MSSTAIRQQAESRGPEARGRTHEVFNQPPPLEPVNRYDVRRIPSR